MSEDERQVRYAVKWGDVILDRRFPSIAAAELYIRQRTAASWVKKTSPIYEPLPRGTAQIVKQVATHYSDWKAISG